MNVIVAFASKHGATGEIARVIAEELRRAGHQAHSLPIESVAFVDDYDAFVVGSAVYTGHWMKEGQQFLDLHRKAMAGKPVWLFSSGPIGDPLKPEEDPVDVAELATSVGAIDHRVFPGRLDRSRLGFGEKAMVIALRAPEGDFRDWDAVTAWAAEIATSLEPAPSRLAG